MVDAVGDIHILLPVPAPPAGGPAEAPKCARSLSGSMMDAERRQSARILTNFAKTSRYCLGEMTAAVVLLWYHDRTCRYNDVLNVAKSACAALSSM